MNKLDLDYQNLLKDILENGVKKEDRTGTGTLSVFGRQIRHKMSDGFPLLTTKKMFMKGIVTELLWFLRGDTNIKYLLENDCNIWNGDAYKNYCEQQSRRFIQGCTYQEFVEKIKTDDEFAKEWGELGPVYGKQWRAWGGTKKVPDGWEYGIPVSHKEVPVNDQIYQLIEDLKNNPDSRRLMVNAWNVSEIDQMTLPPCHYGFQVYTRELSLGERAILANHHAIFISPMTVESWDRDNIPTRAISLMWNQRSVDTFLGLPFNIASYGLLLEIIAKEVNMVPDELIGNLGDTHLYSDHVEQAKEQIGRDFTEEEIQEHLRESGMDALKDEARLEYISKLPKRTREPYPLPKLILHDWYSTQGSGLNSSEEISYFLKSIYLHNIEIKDYKSHPTIKASLSN